MYTIRFQISQTTHLDPNTAHEIIDHNINLDNCTPIESTIYHHPKK
ncbi:hypothetical protein DSUL_110001 [Desulfovibrionales bacterium]